ncbi:hypothetical protein SAMN04489859_101088 [Paracoccus alcaliphilus]|uniref:Uncharacterized protein n=1 Tax=Paracoccus alcaliphilus TaxID=34002 RepID=A0A1H8HTR9_9RHOB|nr:hypothetical protein SAMN04489859_101088 [Paracoccus alcaliphilus]
MTLHALPRHSREHASAFRSHTTIRCAEIEEIFHG